MRYLSIIESHLPEVCSSHRCVSNFFEVDSEKEAEKVFKMLEKKERGAVRQCCVQARRFKEMDQPTNR